MGLARGGGVLRRVLVQTEEENTMTNIVLFRLTGDDAIWLADLEAGTVERTDAFESDRDSGQTQGVDFAVAATSRSEAASHYMFPSRGAQVDGVDFAHAAKARSDAASHYMFPSRGGQADGVDFVHAAKARSDAASHYMFPSHAPQVDGVDFAHAAKARASAAPHHLFPSR